MDQRRRSPRKGDESAHSINPFPAGARDKEQSSADLLGDACRFLSKISPGAGDALTHALRLAQDRAAEAGKKGSKPNSAPTSTTPAKQVPAKPTSQKSSPKPPGKPPGKGRNPKVPKGGSKSKRNPWILARIRNRIVARFRVAFVGLMSFLARFDGSIEFDEAAGAGSFIKTNWRRIPGAALKGSYLSVLSHLPSLGSLISSAPIIGPLIGSILQLFFSGHDLYKTVRSKLGSEWVSSKSRRLIFHLTLPFRRRAWAESVLDGSGIEGTRRETAINFGIELSKINPAIAEGFLRLVREHDNLILSEVITGIADFIGAVSLINPDEAQSLIDMFNGDPVFLNTFNGKICWSDQQAMLEILQVLKDRGLEEQEKEIRDIVDSVAKEGSVPEYGLLMDKAAFVLDDREKIAKVRMIALLSIWAHEGQTRADKETPYIVHPLSVATMALEYGITDLTIIFSMLLHDVKEDQRERYDFIKQFITQMLGEKEARKVILGVHMLSHRQENDMDEYINGLLSPDNLKARYPEDPEILEDYKDLFESTQDRQEFVRGIQLAKVFDILHNLRSLESLDWENNLEASEDLALRTFDKVVNKYVPKFIEGANELTEADKAMFYAAVGEIIAKYEGLGDGHPLGKIASKLTGLKKICSDHINPRRLDIEQNISILLTCLYKEGLLKESDTKSCNDGTLNEMWGRLDKRLGRLRLSYPICNMWAMLGFGLTVICSAAVPVILFLGGFTLAFLYSLNPGNRLDRTKIRKREIISARNAIGSLQSRRLSKNEFNEFMKSVSANDFEALRSTEGIHQRIHEISDSARYLRLTESGEYATPKMLHERLSELSGLRCKFGYIKSTFFNNPNFHYNNKIADPPLVFALGGIASAIVGFTPPFLLAILSFTFLTFLARNIKEIHGLMAVPDLKKQLEDIRPVLEEQGLWDTALSEIDETSIREPVSSGTPAESREQESTSMETDAAPTSKPAKKSIINRFRGLINQPKGRLGSTFRKIFNLHSVLKFFLTFCCVTGVAGAVILGGISIAPSLLVGPVIVGLAAAFMAYRLLVKTGRISGRGQMNPLRGLKGLASRFNNLGRGWKCLSISVFIAFSFCAAFFPILAGVALVMGSGIGLCLMTLRYGGMIGNGELIYKGNRCLERGEPGKAISFFESCIIHQPGNRRAHELRIQALQMLGEDEKVITALEKMQELGLLTASQAYIKKAERFLVQGRLADAKESFEKGISSAAKGEKMLVGLWYASAFEEAGDPEGARAIYDAVLAGEERNPEALMGKGSILARHGLFDEAIDHLDYVIARGDGRQRAGALRRKGDVLLTRALTCFDGVNLQEDTKIELEEVLDVYNQAIIAGGETNDSAFSYLARGDIYALLGKEKEARDCYKRALKTDPSSMKPENILKKGLSRPGDIFADTAKGWTAIWEKREHIVDSMRYPAPGDGSFWESLGFRRSRLEYPDVSEYKDVLGKIGGREDKQRPTLTNYTNTCPGGKHSFMNRFILKARRIKELFVTRRSVLMTTGIVSFGLAGVAGAMALVGSTALPVLSVISLMLGFIFLGRFLLRSRGGIKAAWVPPRAGNVFRKFTRILDRLTLYPHLTVILCLPAVATYAISSYIASLGIQAPLYSLLGIYAVVLFSWSVLGGIFYNFNDKYNTNDLVERLRRRRAFRSYGRDTVYVLARDKGIKESVLATFVLESTTSIELFDRLKEEGLLPESAEYKKNEFEAYARYLWDGLKGQASLSFEASGIAREHGLPGIKLYLGGRTFHVIGVHHGPDALVMDVGVVLGLVSDLEKNGINFYSEDGLSYGYGYDYGTEIDDHKITGRTKNVIQAAKNLYVTSAYQVPLILYQKLTGRLASEKLLGIDSIGHMPGYLNKNENQLKERSDYMADVMYSTGKEEVNVILVGAYHIHQVVDRLIERELEEYMKEKGRVKQTSLFMQAKMKAFAEGIESGKRYIDEHIDEFEKITEITDEETLHERRIDAGHAIQVGSIKYRLMGVVHAFIDAGFQAPEGDEVIVSESVRQTRPFYLDRLDTKIFKIVSYIGRRMGFIDHWDLERKIFNAAFPIYNVDVCFRRPASLLLALQAIFSLTTCLLAIEVLGILGISLPGSFLLFIPAYFFAKRTFDRLLEDFRDLVYAEKLKTLPEITSCENVSVYVGVVHQRGIEKYLKDGKLRKDRWEYYAKSRIYSVLLPFFMDLQDSMKIFCRITTQDNGVSESEVGDISENEGPKEFMEKLAPRSREDERLSEFTALVNNPGTWAGISANFKRGFRYRKWRLKYFFKELKDVPKRGFLKDACRKAIKRPVHLLVNILSLSAILYLAPSVGLVFLTAFGITLLPAAVVGFIWLLGASWFLNPHIEMMLLTFLKKHFGYKREPTPHDYGKLFYQRYPEDLKRIRKAFNLHRMVRTVGVFFGVTFLLTGFAGAVILGGIPIGAPAVLAVVGVVAVLSVIKWLTSRRGEETVNLEAEIKRHHKPYAKIWRRFKKTVFTEKNANRAQIFAGFGLWIGSMAGIVSLESLFAAYPHLLYPFIAVCGFSWLMILNGWGLFDQTPFVPVQDKRYVESDDPQDNMKDGLKTASSTTIFTSSDNPLRVDVEEYQSPVDGLAPEFEVALKVALSSGEAFLKESLDRHFKGMNVLSLKEQLIGRAYVLSFFADAKQSDEDYSTGLDCMLELLIAGVNLPVALEGFLFSMAVETIPDEERRRIARDKLAVVLSKDSLKLAEDSDLSCFLLGGCSNELSDLQESRPFVEGILHMISMIGEEARRTVLLESLFNMLLKGAAVSGAEEVKTVADLINEIIEKIEDTDFREDAERKLAECALNSLTVNKPKILVGPRGVEDVVEPASGSDRLGRDRENLPSVDLGLMPVAPRGEDSIQGELKKALSDTELQDMEISVDAGGLDWLKTHIKSPGDRIVSPDVYAYFADGKIIVCCEKDFRMCPAKAEEIKQHLLLVKHLWKRVSMDDGFKELFEEYVNAGSPLIYHSFNAFLWEKSRDLAREFMDKHSDYFTECKEIKEILLMESLYKEYEKEFKRMNADGIVDCGRFMKECELKPIEEVFGKLETLHILLEEHYSEEEAYNLLQVFTALALSVSKESGFLSADFFSSPELIAEKYPKLHEKIIRLHENLSLQDEREKILDEIYESVFSGSEINSNLPVQKSSPGKTSSNFDRQNAFKGGMMPVTEHVKRVIEYVDKGEIGEGGWIEEDDLWMVSGLIGNLRVHNSDGPKLDQGFVREIKKMMALEGADLLALADALEDLVKDAIIRRDLSILGQNINGDRFHKFYDIIKDFECLFSCSRCHFSQDDNTSPVLLENWKDALTGSVLYKTPLIEALMYLPVIQETVLKGHHEQWRRLNYVRFEGWSSAVFDGFWALVLRDVAGAVREKYPDNASPEFSRALSNLALKKFMRFDKYAKTGTSLDEFNEEAWMAAITGEGFRERLEKEKIEVYNLAETDVRRFGECYENFVETVKNNLPEKLGKDLDATVLDAFVSALKADLARRKDDKSDDLRKYEAGPDQLAEMGKGYVTELLTVLNEPRNGSELRDAKASIKKLLEHDPWTAWRVLSDGLFEIEQGTDKYDLHDLRKNLTDTVNKFLSESRKDPKTDELVTDTISLWITLMNDGGPGFEIYKDVVSKLSGKEMHADAERIDRCYKNIIVSHVNELARLNDVTSGHAGYVLREWMQAEPFITWRWISDVLSEKDIWDKNRDKAWEIIKDECGKIQDAENKGDVTDEELRIMQVWCDVFPEGMELEGARELIPWLYGTGYPADAGRIIDLMAYNITALRERYSYRGIYYWEDIFELVTSLIGSKEKDAVMHAGDILDALASRIVSDGRESGKYADKCIELMGLVYMTLEEPDVIEDRTGYFISRIKTGTGYLDAKALVKLIVLYKSVADGIERAESEVVHVLKHVRRYAETCDDIPLEFNSGLDFLVSGLSDIYRKSRNSGKDRARCDAFSPAFGDVMRICWLNSIDYGSDEFNNMLIRPEDPALESDTKDYFTTKIAECSEYLDMKSLARLIGVYEYTFDGLAGRNTEVGHILKYIDKFARMCGDDLTEFLSAFDYLVPVLSSLYVAGDGDEIMQELFSEALIDLTHFCWQKGIGFDTQAYADIIMRLDDPDLVSDATRYFSGKIGKAAQHLGGKDLIALIDIYASTVNRAVDVSQDYAQLEYVLGYVKKFAEDCQKGPDEDSQEDSSKASMQYSAEFVAGLGPLVSGLLDLYSKPWSDEAKLEAFSLALTRLIGVCWVGNIEYGSSEYENILIKPDDPGLVSDPTLYFTGKISEAARHLEQGPMLLLLKVYGRAIDKLYERDAKVGYVLKFVEEYLMMCDSVPGEFVPSLDRLVDSLSCLYEAAGGDDNLLRFSNILPDLFQACRKRGMEYDSDEFKNILGDFESELERIYLKIRDNTEQTTRLYSGMKDNISAYLEGTQSGITQFIDDMSLMESLILAGLPPAPALVADLRKVEDVRAQISKYRLKARDIRVNGLTDIDDRIAVIVCESVFKESTPGEIVEQNRCSLRATSVLSKEQLEERAARIKKNWPIFALKGDQVIKYDIKSVDTERVDEFIKENIVDPYERLMKLDLGIPEGGVRSSIIGRIYARLNEPVKGSPEEKFLLEHPTWGRYLFAFTRLHESTGESVYAERVLKKYFNENIEEVIKEISDNSDEALLKALYEVSLEMQKIPSLKEDAIRLIPLILVSWGYSELQLRNMLASENIKDRTDAIIQIFGDRIKDLPISTGRQPLEVAFQAIDTVYNGIKNELEKISEISVEAMYGMEPALGLEARLAGNIGVDCTKGHLMDLHPDAVIYYPHTNGKIRGYIRLFSGKDKKGNPVLTIDTMQRISPKLVRNILVQFQKIAIEKGYAGIALPETLGGTFNYPEVRAEIREIKEYHKGEGIRLVPLTESEIELPSGHSMSKGKFIMLKTFPENAVGVSGKDDRIYFDGNENGIESMSMDSAEIKLLLTTTLEDEHSWKQLLELVNETGGPERIVKAFTELHSESFKIHMELAFVIARLGLLRDAITGLIELRRYSEASMLCSRIDPFMPHYVEAQIIRAIVRIKQGVPNDAGKFLDTAFKYMDSHAATDEALADVKYAIKLLDSGEIDYKDAVNSLEDAMSHGDIFFSRQYASHEQLKCDYAVYLLTDILLAGSESSKNVLIDWFRREEGALSILVSAANRINRYMQLPEGIDLESDINDIWDVIQTAKSLLNETPAAEESNKPATSLNPYPGAKLFGREMGPGHRDRRKRPGPDQEICFIDRDGAVPVKTETGSGAFETLRELFAGPHEKLHSLGFSEDVCVAFDMMLAKALSGQTREIASFDVGLANALDLYVRDQVRAYAYHFDLKDVESVDDVDEGSILSYLDRIPLLEKERLVLMRDIYANTFSRGLEGLPEGAGKEDVLYCIEDAVKDSAQLRRIMAEKAGLEKVYINGFETGLTGVRFDLLNFGEDADKEALDRADRNLKYEQYHFSLLSDIAGPEYAKIRSVRKNLERLREIIDALKEAPSSEDTKWMIILASGIIDDVINESEDFRRRFYPEMPFKEYFVSRRYRALMQYSSVEKLHEELCFCRDNEITPTRWTIDAAEYYLQQLCSDYRTAQTPERRGEKAAGIRKIADGVPARFKAETESVWRETEEVLSDDEKLMHDLLYTSHEELSDGDVSYLLATALSGSTYSAVAYMMLVRWYSTVGDAGERIGRGGGIADSICRNLDLGMDETKAFIGGIESCAGGFTKMVDKSGEDNAAAETHYMYFFTGVVFQNPEHYDVEKVAAIAEAACRIIEACPGELGEEWDLGIKLIDSVAANPDEFDPEYILAMADAAIRVGKVNRYLALYLLENMGAYPKAFRGRVDKAASGAVMIFGDFGTERAEDYIDGIHSGGWTIKNPGALEAEPLTVVIPYEETTVLRTAVSDETQRGVLIGRAMKALADRNPTPLECECFLLAAAGYTVDEINGELGLDGSAGEVLPILAGLGNLIMEGSLTEKGSLAVRNILEMPCGLPNQEKIKALEERFKEEGREIIEAKITSTTELSKALHLTVIGKKPVIKLDLTRMPKLKPYLEEDYGSPVTLAVTYGVLIRLFRDFLYEHMRKDELDYIVWDAIRNALLHGNKLDTSLPIYLYIDPNKPRIEVYDPANEAELTHKQRSEVNKFNLGGLNCFLKDVVYKKRWTYSAETLTYPGTTEKIGTRMTFISQKEQVSDRNAEPLTNNPFSGVGPHHRSRKERPGPRGNTFFIDREAAVPVKTETGSGAFETLHELFAGPHEKLHSLGFSEDVCVAFDVLLAKALSEQTVRIKEHDKGLAQALDKYVEERAGAYAGHFGLKEIDIADIDARVILQELGRENPLFSDRLHLVADIFSKRLQNIITVEEKSGREELLSSIEQTVIESAKCIEVAGKLKRKGIYPGKTMWLLYDDLTELPQASGEFMMCLESADRLAEIGVNPVPYLRFGVCYLCEARRTPAESMKCLKIAENLAERSIDPRSLEVEGVLGTVEACKTSDEFMKCLDIRDRVTEKGIDLFALIESTQKSSLKAGDWTGRLNELLEDPEMTGYPGFWPSLGPVLWILMESPKEIHMDEIKLRIQGVLDRLSSKVFDISSMDSERIADLITSEEAFAIVHPKYILSRKFGESKTEYYKRYLARLNELFKFSTVPVLVFIEKSKLSKAKVRFAEMDLQSPVILIATCEGSAIVPGRDKVIELLKTTKLKKIYLGGESRGACVLTAEEMLQEDFEVELLPYESFDYNWAGQGYNMGPSDSYVKPYRHLISNDRFSGLHSSREGGNANASSPPKNVTFDTRLREILDSLPEGHRLSADAALIWLERVERLKELFDGMGARGMDDETWKDAVRRETWPYAWDSFDKNVLDRLADGGDMTVEEFISTIFKKVRTPPTAVNVSRCEKDYIKLVNGLKESGYVPPSGRPVNVVELACGGGLDTRAVVLTATGAKGFSNPPLPYNYLGFDKKEPEIELARKNNQNPDCIFRAEIVEGDLSPFGVTYGEVDIVYINGHETEGINDIEWRNIFTNAASMLRPGGILAIQSWYGADYARLKELLGDMNLDEFDATYDEGKTEESLFILKKKTTEAVTNIPRPRGESSDGDAPANGIIGGCVNMPFHTNRVLTALQEGDPVMIGEEDHYMLSTQVGILRDNDLRDKIDAAMLAEVAEILGVPADPDHIAARLGLLSYLVDLSKKSDHSVKFNEFGHPLPDNAAGDRLVKAPLEDVGGLTHGFMDLSGEYREFVRELGSIHTAALVGQMPAENIPYILSFLNELSESSGFEAVRRLLDSNVGGTLGLDDIVNALLSTPVAKVEDIPYIAALSGKGYGLEEILSLYENAGSLAASGMEPDVISFLVSSVGVEWTASIIGVHALTSSLAPSQDATFDPSTFTAAEIDMIRSVLERLEGLNVEDMPGIFHTPCGGELDELLGTEILPSIRTLLGIGMPSMSRVETVDGIGCCAHYREADGGVIRIMVNNVISSETTSLVARNLKELGMTSYFDSLTRLQNNEAVHAAGEVDEGYSLESWVADVQNILKLQYLVYGLLKMHEATHGAGREFHNSHVGAIPASVFPGGFPGEGPVAAQTASALHSMGVTVPEGAVLTRAGRAWEISASGSLVCQLREGGEGLNVCSPDHGDGQIIVSEVDYNCEGIAYPMLAALAQALAVNDPQGAGWYEIFEDIAMNAFTILRLFGIEADSAEYRAQIKRIKAMVDSRMVWDEIYHELYVSSKIDKSGICGKDLRPPASAAELELMAKELESIKSRAADGVPDYAEITGIVATFLVVLAYGHGREQGMNELAENVMLELFASHREGMEDTVKKLAALVPG